MPIPWKEVIYVYYILRIENREIEIGLELELLGNAIFYKCLLNAQLDGLTKI